MKFRVHWKKSRVGLWSFASLCLVTVFGGGVYAYQQFFRSIPAEELLPGSVDFVAHAVVNPESDQFRLLEEHAEKFPGYNLLKKKMDPAGEGATLSSVLQDKFQDFDLDFQNDILSVVGDYAYFAVLDVRPVGQNIRQSDLFSVQRIERFAAIADGDMSTTLSGSPSVVLGDTSTQSTAPAKMDFLFAATIEDLSEARKMLGKIKRESSYVVDRRSRGGHPYFSVRLSQDMSKGSISRFFNCQETFHSIVGRNWVMTSSEKSIQEVIDRSLSQGPLAFFRQFSFGHSLAADAQFQSVQGGFNQEENRPFLASLFYRFSYEDLFPSQCEDKTNCEAITDYFRHPDEVVDGLKIRFSDDGLHLSSASNSVILSQMNLDSVRDGLSNRIPETAGGRWINAYWEHANPKLMYYNFKRNNLTEPGIQHMNEWIALLAEVGLDPERDIIDQIDGNVAWAALTKAEMDPGVAVVAKVKDKTRMIDSMRKIVEFMKRTSLEMNQHLHTLLEGDGSSPDREEAYREYVKKIMESGLTETPTSDGVVYSYKSPSGTVSFDFAVENSVFLISTHYAITTDILRAFRGQASSTPLSENRMFSEATDRSRDSAYARLFVYPPGLWSGVQYYFDSIMTQIEQMNPNALCDSGDQCEVSSNGRGLRDTFDALGAIVRTIDSVAAQYEIRDGFANVFTDANFKQIPQEEKLKTEKFFERIPISEKNK